MPPVAFSAAWIAAIKVGLLRKLDSTAAGSSGMEAQLRCPEWSCIMGATAMAEAVKKAAMAMGLGMVAPEVHWR